MKTYKLTTRNELEEVSVHHTMKGEMNFDNLEDAIIAFEKESKELKETYKSFDDVDFGEEQVKDSDKYSCRINLIIDGEVDFESEEGLEIEETYTSELYFE